MHVGRVKEYGLAALSENYRLHAMPRLTKSPNYVFFVRFFDWNDGQRVVHATTEPSTKRQFLQSLYDEQVAARFS